MTQSDFSLGKMSLGYPVEKGFKSNMFGIQEAVVVVQWK